MSQQIWNIHNCSKSPQQRQNQPPAYQMPNNIVGHTSSAEIASSFNENLAIPSQSFMTHRPSCMYIENETIRNRIELNSWRQSASIEDWKAFLYSAPSSPAIQTPVIQQRHMTPYSYNVENSGNNPNMRRFSQDHSQLNTYYHQQTHNGAYKAVNEPRHRVLSGAVENKRTTSGRLQSNNLRGSGWYQHRPEQKRGREKSQYFNFSPELIRYVDPAQLEREPRSGLEYVELLMFNTHEDGYVTLDEKAMKILVNAIDKALPKISICDC